MGRTARPHPREASSSSLQMRTFCGERVPGPPPPRSRCSWRGAPVRGAVNSHSLPRPPRQSQCSKWPTLVSGAGASQRPPAPVLKQLALSSGAWVAVEQTGQVGGCPEWGGRWAAACGEALPGRTAERLDGVHTQWPAFSMQSISSEAGEPAAWISQPRLSEAPGGLRVVGAISLHISWF